MTTVRCPNCEATYNVDPAKLADGGRKLRCAQCQTIWLATLESATVAPVVAPVEDVVAEQVAETPLETPAEAPVEGATVAEETPAELNEEFAPPTEEMLVQRTPGVDALVKVGGWRQWIRGGNVWRTLAMLVLVGGLLAGAGVVWKKMQPPVDLTTDKPVAPVEVVKVSESTVVQPPKGIILHRVRGEVTEVDGEGGGVALTVRGLLTNTTSNTISVPPMRLELLGEDGQVADMWPVSGVTGTMEPKAEQAWTVSLTAPDMSAIQGWRVVFVKE